MAGPSLDAFSADRGVAALLSRLTHDATLLLQQEVALAKAEFVERFGTMGKGVVGMVCGLMLLFAGLLVMLAAAVAALTLVVAVWLAALIVGAVVMLSGTVLLLLARRALAIQGIVPRRTLATLRADANWAREQMR